MLGQRLCYNFNYLCSLKKKKLDSKSTHRGIFSLLGVLGKEGSVGLGLGPGGALSLQAPSGRG